MENDGRYTSLEIEDPSIEDLKTHALTILGVRFWPIIWEEPFYNENCNKVTLGKVLDTDKRITIIE